MRTRTAKPLAWEKALSDTGLGFLPPRRTILILELSEKSLKYFERFITNWGNDLVELIVIIPSNGVDSDEYIVDSPKREIFLDDLSKLYFTLRSRVFEEKHTEVQNWPRAIKKVLAQVSKRNIFEITLLTSCVPERANGLIDLLSDSQDRMTSNNLQLPYF